MSDNVYNELKKVAIPTGVMVPDFTTEADSTLGIGGSDIERMRSFLNELKTEPTILNIARVINQNQQRLQIEKIYFDEDSYLLEPVEEGADITNENAANFNYTYLTTKEFGGYISITDKALEDYRTGNALWTYIRRLITEKLRRDIAKIALNGDTTSDTFALSYMNGFRKLADSGNVIDADGAELSKDLLDEAVDTLDDKYHTNDIRFLMNRRMMNNFAIILRENNIGGSMLSDMFYLGNYEKVRFNEAGFSLTPYMSTYTYSGSDSSDILLTDPRNLIVGFTRRITFESERSASRRATLLYFTLRFGLKIEENNAIVKIKNVKLNDFS